MAGIIECIPNFSEGRDKAVIRALCDAASAVPGVALLDHSSDESHNRSVLTLAGSPEGIAEAAFRLCAVACEKIDMASHSGGHPRIGATDVIPFVPLRGADMRSCVSLSKAVAARIWEELRIPSFLYEESAASPARRNLADVRRGQFEGMPQKLLLPEWAPDFGTRAIHPTAGVTAIGARFPLVAYNVNLDTPDVSIARAIAKAIRGSSGGFRHCKAIGVMLGGRNVAQVSMNMVNFEGTPLYRAHEAIRAEARRWGVGIAGSEIVGLVPAKALADCAAYYLQLEGFSYEKQALEARLEEAADSARPACPAPEGRTERTGSAESTERHKDSACAEDAYAAAAPSRTERSDRHERIGRYDRHERPERHASHSESADRPDFFERPEPEPLPAPPPERGGRAAAKPEFMTSLRGAELVFKDHKAIRLRGKLDSFEAKLLETALAMRRSGDDRLAADLGEVLGYARLVMRGEVLEEPLPPMRLFGLGEAEIRERSHFPQKYYNVPHFMPIGVGDGERALMLNTLRTMAREAELCAYEAFRDAFGVPSREDIVLALNRLSSALYLLMLRARAGEYGAPGNGRHGDGRHGAPAATTAAAAATATAAAAAAATAATAATATTAAAALEEG